VAGGVGRSGTGGAGIISNITGSSIQYAGGGGGGAQTDGSGLSVNIGLGGGGGGGSGGYAFAGSAGLANTGGGGGGGAKNYTGVAGDFARGGSGGSGIVVIRYPAGQGLPQSTTGSPRTYITGPYRVYVWVSSGSITF
jgi:hypothetical protein